MKRSRFAAFRARVDQMRSMNVCLAFESGGGLTPLPQPYTEV
jgi:hypothetical protein